MKEFSSVLMLWAWEFLSMLFVTATLAMLVRGMYVVNCNCHCPTISVENLNICNLIMMG